jgi:hypothetical protein
MNGVRTGWRWFRARPLPLQMVAWSVLAIIVAAVGLAIEQRPPSNSSLASAPDTGGGSSVGSGAVVSNNSGGVEGADVQQKTGARHYEVGGVKVGKNFTATNASVARVFNEALNNRGRAGLNANQLISVNCAAGNCVIKYVPDGPGAGRIIEAQGPIWEALLKDPNWKSATMETQPGGPDLLGRGGPPRRGGGPPPGHGPPAVIISCTRSQVVAVGVWATQSAPRITRLCRVAHQENKGA